MSPKFPVPVLASTSWEFWWFCNREEFLGVTPNMRAAEAALAVPQAGHNQQVGRPLTASERDLKDFVLPELYRQLKTSRSRDVRTACLIAMAKIGMDHEKHALVPLFLSMMRTGGQQVRETAALALGILHRPEALPILLDLIRDTRRAETYVGRNSVGDRTRAFAIYGLGLLAHKSKDIAIKEAAFKVLSERLTKRGEKDRDILVASIQAMGALNPDLQHASHKRLLWRILPVLQEYSERKLGKSREVTQAHVPTAVARLLGRGHTVDHQRWKALFLKRITRGKKPHDNVTQSIALAFGRMVEAPEDHEEDAVYSELLQKKFKKDKNQLVRAFSLIALGRIGGEDNRSFLLRAMAKRSKTPMRPWTALSLGVLGFATRADGSTDSLVGKVLQKHRPNPKRRSKAGGGENAVSFALALSGYGADGPLTPDGYTRGLAALDGNYGLAGLERQIVNPETPPHILAAAAQAFQLYGDRSSLPVLVKSMRTKKMPYLVIAFVAAAIGGIADKESQPWNWVYRSGTNYAARVPTLENGLDGILDIL